MKILPRELNLCVLTVGLVAALVFTACAGQSPQLDELAAQPTSTPAPSQRGIGDTLELYYWQAPTILNPHLTTNLKDWDAPRITLEPLASFDAKGNLVPFLAAEIPSLENGGVAQDGRSVTWKLKQEVKWSDGEPFTADDVVFTYEFITNKETGAAPTSVAAYDLVESVKAIDDYTIQVNFREVNPAWSLPFVGIAGMILPRHIYEAYNGPNAQESLQLLPVGTGPYRTKKFQTEAFLILENSLVETKKIVYEPNPFFREEDKPFFSRVELKGGGDAQEGAYSVLEIGDVDFAWNLQLDAQELARLEGLGQGKVIVNPGPRIERILLNRTDPRKFDSETGERSSVNFVNPFLSDKRVRQAIAYAVDRESIIGLGEIPTSNNLILPPQYNSPNTSYEFNLDKAAALLDEAGWIDHDGDNIRDKDGVKLSLTFQTTVNPLRQKIQEMVRKNLAQIGVEVKLETVDGTIFFGSDTSNPGHYRQFQADMEVYRDGNTSPDPSAYMKYWTCDQIPKKANNWTGENVERWCNDTYNELYEQSTREIDPEKRAQLFIQMNDLLIEDVVMIPLLNRSQVDGVSHDLVGLDPTPWDAATWNIKDWRREQP